MRRGPLCRRCSIPALTTCWNLPRPRPDWRIWVVEPMRVPHLEIVVRFAIVLLAVLTLALPADAEPRVALVIGNSSYGGALGELPNPANDSRLMAKTLKRIGFAVIEAENADQAAMKRAIQAFGAQLADAGVGATGLF